MYTQCPECSTAFRVTADVLKQAAGKVRCGSCGNAFNALDYLSETMPDRQPKKEIDEQLPELKPEPLPNERVSISAEQSAALLKTLDELAGSDIRIEDTGVEWRVLDDDELGEAASDDIAVDIDVEDQPEIDEILEDSPTPVDQFLTDTPPEVDSPEIFAEGASDPARTPVEELRFDDNTPLPEDFDLDEVFRSPTGEDEPPAPPESEPGRAAAPQVDLDLSEPDEWTDILDEFEELVDDLAEDEVDEKDKAPLDVDAQFALQAEAMGIDLSGMHETLEAPAAEDAAESDIDNPEMQPRAPEAEDREIEALLPDEIVEEVDTGADHEPVAETHDDVDTLDDEVDDQVAEAGADDAEDGEDHAAAAQLDLIEELIQSEVGGA